MNKDAFNENPWTMLPTLCFPFPAADLRQDLRLRPVRPPRGLGILLLQLGVGLDQHHPHHQRQQTITGKRLIVIGPQFHCYVYTDR